EAMETVSWGRGQTTRKYEESRARGRSLHEYGETRPQRTRGRRELSTRRADPQARGRHEKAGGDRRDAAGRSGARTGAQRGSDESTEMDNQVLAPSRASPCRQRTSHPEVCPGRDLA